MWRILLESLKNGVTTAPDPDGAALPPERFRGQVMLNPDQCDLSGTCARVCPTGAITLSDDPAARRTRWAVDHARCIFCGLCQEACPRGAIALGRQDQLAVRRLDDLRVSVTFPWPVGRPATEVADHG